MNRDEVMRMAREACGEPAWSGGVEWTWEEVERFAALVAEAEREACAKVCEILWDTTQNGMATEEEEWYGDKCAAAIRKRGAP